MKTPPPHARHAAAVVAAALLGLVSACGSGGPAGVGGSGGSSSTPAGSGGAPTSSPAATSGPGSTLPGQLPTVFDCGGGAYEPATLLVVCGVATTTVTEARWTSWDTAAAAGAGTVRIPGRVPEPASLRLRNVVATDNGPQFSQLQVTFTGASPDGHPSDVYRLATAPAPA